MQRLCLTRRIGQKIVIGDDVTLTVIDVGQGKTRLMFETPDESIEIDRIEVREKKRAGLLQPPLAMDDHDTRVLNNWLGELEYGEAGA